MDLYSMYLPDALSYTSFRSPAYYRDYETQPFDNERKRSCDYKERRNQSTTHHSTQINNQQQKHHGHYYNNYIQQQSTKHSQQKRESCPFCKEEKRRPLGAYLRSKGNSNHKDSISEQEEDQEVVETCQRVKDIEIREDESETETEKK